MDINIKADLKKLFEDFEWKFKGIIDEDGNLYPIPKIPQVITGIFEMVAQEKIEQFAKREYGCKVIHGGAREYPNLTLTRGKLGKRKIATEAKTSRRGKKNRCSRMSLGSYAGYFRFPNEKRAGCKFPYGSFSEHWIVGFVYTWKPKADSLRMVSDVEVIVQPKWRIASTKKATGDTAAIGSINDIAKMRSGNGEFRSEKEFEHYWRTRPVRRGR